MPLPHRHADQPAAGGAALGSCRGGGGFRLNILPERAYPLFHPNRWPWRSVAGMVIEPSLASGSCRMACSTVQYNAVQREVHLGSLPGWSWCLDLHLSVSRHLHGGCGTVCTHHIAAAAGQLAGGCMHQRRQLGRVACRQLAAATVLYCAAAPAPWRTAGRAQRAPNHASGTAASSACSSQAAPLQRGTARGRESRLCQQEPGFKLECGSLPTR